MLRFPLSAEILPHARETAQLDMFFLRNQNRVFFFSSTKI